MPKIGCRRWVVSECDGDWHVFDGHDPDVVSWAQFPTREEADAWVAKREARRLRANATRHLRDDVRRSLGLTRNRDGSWE